MICIPLISFCWLLLKLEPHVLYWIDMERVDNLVLLLITMESLDISLHLVRCWLLACCIFQLLCLDMFLYPWSLQDLYHERMLYIVNDFSASNEIIMWVFSSVCLYGGLHWQIFICWTIPVSLCCTWLDHAWWFFSCVLGFGLPVFCWVILHQYSWVNLVCNSLR